MKGRNEQTLIIMVSDMEDYPRDLQTMLDYLEEMRDKGHIVNVLHMGRRDWLKYTTDSLGQGGYGDIRRRLDSFDPQAVEDENDLSGLVLGSMKEFLN
jgi:hypothetical protein